MSRPAMVILQGLSSITTRITLHSSKALLNLRNGPKDCSLGCNKSVHSKLVIFYSNGTYHIKAISVIAKKLNSVACVCERTIPTERPPLVGEVSANFCG
jgi:hypothetical protein